MITLGSERVKCLTLETLVFIVLPSQQFLQFLSNRSKGEFVLHPALGTAKVAHKDNTLGIVLQTQLDTWQRSNNSEHRGEFFVSGYR